MKKVCKWFVLFIIIFSFILYISKYFAYDLAIRWNIYVPMISKDETIFIDVFQDGDLIRKLSFNSKKKTQWVLNKYKFIKVDSENNDDIKMKISDFYERLNDEGKEIFDNNFDVDSMINESSGNYYYFKSKYEEKAFIIFIYVASNDKLYIFESIRH